MAVTGWPWRGNLRLHNTRKMVRCIEERREAEGGRAFSRCGTPRSRTGAGTADAAACRARSWWRTPPLASHCSTQGRGDKKGPRSTSCQKASNKQTTNGRLAGQLAYSNRRLFFSGLRAGGGSGVLTPSRQCPKEIDEETHLFGLLTTLIVGLRPTNFLYIFEPSNPRSLDGSAIGPPATTFLGFIRLGGPINWGGFINQKNIPQNHPKLPKSPKLTFLADFL